MRPPCSPLPRSLAIAAAIASLGACGGGDDGDDDTRDDQAATFSARQVASAVDSGGELARLLIPLQANAALVGLSPPEAVARKIVDATTSFRGAVQDSGCVGIATDGATYLTVTFTACRLGVLWTLEGAFTGMLVVEPGTPDNVLALTLDVPGVTLTGPEHAFHVEGFFGLRQAIVDGPPAPVMFEGDLRYAIDGNPTLAMSAAATWSTSQTAAGTCADLTGGAQLSGDALGAAGPISLSAEDVVRCADQCPSGGDVELSYGTGKLLTWRYDGDATVLVTGPRGRQLEVTLPCGGT